MPTVKQNLFWDRYPWLQEGDEWQDQATHTGQAYPAWKASLIDTFIRPYVRAVRVVEIGPGHGRWSEHILKLGAASLHLVELSENSLRYLEHKFAGASISTHQTAGSDLGVAPGQADFVFSYDSLVHCEWPEIQGYIDASAHALTPGGIAVLHTPGAGAAGGQRGNVTRDQVAEAARAAGFDLIEQVDSWGPVGQYTCTLFGDVVTTARKV